MDHRQNCDALAIEINRFGDVLEGADFEVPVPGCPDWTVRDLALHLGTIHRWAERLVANVAQIRQSSLSMGLVLEPVGPTWIRSGGRELLDTLDAGDPAAPMWTWGADQHLAWWSRRQLHETLIHRTDLEAARGIISEVSTELAADAIDEFLVNLKCAAVFSPKVREIKGSGEVLTIRAIDADWGWSVHLRPDGFEITGLEGSGDAELSGPALELLLVLYRRLALSRSRLVHSGRRDVLDVWLANSALE
jgi:uncharacterized protein (TIGR03083 family)